MTIRMLMAFLVAGAIAGRGSGADENRSDRDRLQGRWLFVSITENGKINKAPDGAKGSDKPTLTVRGDRWKHAHEGTYAEATFTLDAMMALKTIDWQYGQGGDSYKGIYELNGDNLRICWNAEGEKRPTEFVAKKGDNQVLWVLKRMK